MMGINPFLWPSNIPLYTWIDMDGTGTDYAK